MRIFSSDAKQIVGEIVKATNGWLFTECYGNRRIDPPYHKDNGWWVILFGEEAHGPFASDREAIASIVRTEK